MRNRFRRHIRTYFPEGSSRGSVHQQVPPPMMCCGIVHTAKNGGSRIKLPEFGKPGGDPIELSGRSKGCCLLHQLV